MSAFDEVVMVLGRYFDGLHHGNAALLAEVFHPEAHYYTATEGRLLHLAMPEYFDIVRQRPSPASQGHARTDRIDSIEFAGPVTALARVACSVPPRYFTDLLTLVKLDGRWRIVAKVFEFVLKEDAKAAPAPALG
jgi:4-oxalocrotonate tautomerase